MHIGIQLRQAIPAQTAVTSSLAARSYRSGRTSEYLAIADLQYGREYRTAVGMALDVSNVRQEENMYLSMSSDEVASYPEEIQRLLGWTAGSNHMGWVEIDGQMMDPIYLLGDQDRSKFKGVGAARHMAEEALHV